MSIKEVYKNLLVNRYNNKQYYDKKIEFEYSNNIIRVASPNCSTRLVLKADFNSTTLISLKYSLSGDMFAFVVTELIIDYLLIHTKEECKHYIYNLNNKVDNDSNEQLDAILKGGYSISIKKILGYFTLFVNSYWI